MDSEVTGLLCDENGRGRGSFTGEWLITYKRGRVEGEYVIFPTRLCAVYEPSPSLTLLEDFIEFADGDATAIRRFARKYGALGLCEHGLPSGHRLGKSRCFRQLRPGDEISESLRAWHHYAARAQSILHLAAAVADNRDGDESKWRVLGSRSMLGKRGAPIPKPGDREYQKQYLAYEVRAWLNECRVRPAVTWEGTAPVFRLSCGNLLGVIGIAMAGAILKSGMVVTCSACGRLYTPTRKPVAGRNHYCKECREGKRGAKRMWARKHRPETVVLCRV